jgi:hypothetical protein
MSKWRAIRRGAGVSLQKASTDANVTTTTGRVFELGGPEAISDPTKRAACVSVWSAFGDALSCPASQPPDAA